MFPYSMIVASNLLRQNKSRVPVPPKIKTFSQYTDVPEKEFYDLLVLRGKQVGVLEMANIISKWQGFDNLSEKQKIRFVKETLDPEYYSFKNYIKRALSKIF